jgi:hypothetical protein
MQDFPDEEHVIAFSLFVDIFGDETTQSQPRSAAVRSVAFWTLFGLPPLRAPPRFDAPTRAGRQ